jgi:hypothetical protein
MKLKEIVEKSREIAKPFRVSNGEDFRLKNSDPGDTLDFTSEDKPRAKEALSIGIEALAQLQDMLYAQDRWAVLLIFQAMDAAGKDGAIKHVMSGVNPQGCQVFSFKAPSSEDLDHDYLWREHSDQECAVVRRAGGQQVVYAAGRCRRRHRHSELLGTAVSEGRQGEAAGACRGETGLGVGRRENVLGHNPAPSNSRDEQC